MEDLEPSVVCQGIYFSFLKHVSERKEVFPLIFLFKRFQASFQKGYARTLHEEKYPVWTFLTENFHSKITSPPSPFRIPLILSPPSQIVSISRWIPPFLPGAALAVLQNPVGLREDPTRRFTVPFRARGTWCFPKSPPSFMFWLIIINQRFKMAEYYIILY